MALDCMEGALEGNCSNMPSDDLVQCRSRSSGTLSMTDLAFFIPGKHSDCRCLPRTYRDNCCFVNSMMNVRSATCNLKSSRSRHLEIHRDKDDAIGRPAQRPEATTSQRTSRSEQNIQIMQKNELIVLIAAPCRGPTNLDTGISKWRDPA